MLYRTSFSPRSALAELQYDPQGQISGPHARGYQVGVPTGELTDATEWHRGIDEGTGKPRRNPQPPGWRMSWLAPSSRHDEQVAARRGSRTVDRLGLPTGIRACLFDLDGVLTQTAQLHAEAWKETFDSFLRDRSVRYASSRSSRSTPILDYERYVDGRARHDGVREFLAARGIRAGRRHRHRARRPEERRACSS